MKQSTKDFFLQVLPLFQKMPFSISSPQSPCLAVSGRSHVPSRVNSKFASWTEYPGAVWGHLKGPIARGKCQKRSPGRARGERGRERVCLRRQSTVSQPSDDGVYLPSCPARWRPTRRYMHSQECACVVARLIEIVALSFASDFRPCNLFAHLVWSESRLPIPLLRSIFAPNHYLTSQSCKFSFVWMVPTPWSAPPMMLSLP